MNKFNVRIYGLLIENNHILISKEKRNGFTFTKFPGGGLEFGEGTIDCLKREFEEEMNLKIHVADLFYVNDFFQTSAFNKNEQILSFYYIVNSVEPFKIKSINDINLYTENYEYQEWISLSKLSQETMTFPIDKIVAEKLKKSTY